MAEARTFRVLDLFAGRGGLTQGFVGSGSFRPVGRGRDRDDAAIYAVNLDGHVHRCDITEWAGGSVQLAEVVVGGPPCQGFSLLDRRNTSDPRNRLRAE